MKLIEKRICRGKLNGHHNGTKVIMAVVIIGIVFWSSCSPSPQKQAENVSEHFWTLVHLNRLDSFSILYPDFDKLHCVKSTLSCDESSITDVVDLGNGCFEVRTNVNSMGINLDQYSLFIKPSEQGEYYIYDSRGFVHPSQDDADKMIAYGCYDDGNIEIQTTDQQLTIMQDSVIPKIDSTIIAYVNSEITQNLTLLCSPQSGVKLGSVRNNTPFDLSNIEILVNYEQMAWGITMEYSEYVSAPYFPSGKTRSIDLYSFSKLLQPLSIKPLDALKIYQRTGMEYQNYLNALNAQ